MRYQNGQRNAFTLIEIVTVIALLMTLAAISTPVLIAAQNRSHDREFINNLQQIGGALSLYLADNDYCYPPALNRPMANHITWGKGFDPSGWQTQLIHYLHTPMLPRCPSTDLSEWPTELRVNSVTSGYAINLNLNWTVHGPGPITVFKGLPAIRLAEPALTVEIFDARAGIHGLCSPDTSASDNVLKSCSAFMISAEPDILSQEPAAYRHHGGAQYLFCDEHVQWLHPEQIANGQEPSHSRPHFGI